MRGAGGTEESSTQLWLGDKGLDVKGFSDKGIG